MGHHGIDFEYHRNRMGEIFVAITSLQHYLETDHVLKPGPWPCAASRRARCWPLAKGSFGSWRTPCGVPDISGRPWRPTFVPSRMGWNFTLLNLILPPEILDGFGSIFTKYICGILKENMYEKTCIYPFVPSRTLFSWVFWLIQRDWLKYHSIRTYQGLLELGAIWPQFYWNVFLKM